MSLVSPKPGGQGEGGARGCLAPCGIPLGLPALLSTAVSLLLQVGEEGAGTQHWEPKDWVNWDNSQCRDTGRGQGHHGGV